MQQSLTRLIDSVRAHPQMALAVLAVLAVYYGLRRYRTKMTRDADQVLKRMRGERGDAYRDLRRLR